MIYIADPGDSVPTLVANTYLERTCSEIYPDIRQYEAGMKRLFKQFRFPEEFPVTSRPRHLARSTRAENSAIRSAMHSAPPLTIRTLSSPASWATAKPRPDRSQPPGSRINSLIRHPTARCCRSCISTVTRLAIRPFSPVYRTTNWKTSSKVVVGLRCSSRVTRSRSSVFDSGRDSHSDGDVRVLARDCDGDAPGPRPYS